MKNGRVVAEHGLIPGFSRYAHAAWAGPSGEAAKIRHASGSNPLPVALAVKRLQQLRMGGEIHLSEDDVDALVLRVARETGRWPESALLSKAATGRRYAAQAGPRACPRDRTMARSKADHVERITEVWWPSIRLPEAATAQRRASAVKILFAIGQMALRACNTELSFSGRELAEAAGVTEATIYRLGELWRPFVHRKVRGGYAIDEDTGDEMRVRSVWRLVPLGDTERGVPVPFSLRPTGPDVASDLRNPAHNGWHKKSVEWAAFMTLLDAEGPMRAAQLSEALGLSRQSATNTLRRLRDRDLGDDGVDGPHGALVVAEQDGREVWWTVGDVTEEHAEAIDACGVTDHRSTRHEAHEQQRHLADRARAAHHAAKVTDLGERRVPNRPDSTHDWVRAFTSGRIEIDIVGDAEAG
ncbi:MAG: helix-turn-helix domain-containing protein [Actinomycetota bacterium]|nr:helix-turn-helix domain-containing protein [Actinomycetota bacterium]